MTEPRRPMTLANMRANGVRHIIAECRDCRHRAEPNVDALPGELAVPDLGRRFRCSACGSRKVETRPAWHLMAKTAHGS